MGVGCALNYLNFSLLFHISDNCNTRHMFNTIYFVYRYFYTIEENNNTKLDINELLDTIQSLYIGYGIYSITVTKKKLYAGMLNTAMQPTQLLRRLNPNSQTKKKKKTSKE